MTMSHGTGHRNRSGSATAHELRSGEGSGNQNRGSASGTITQGLVDQIADKVYAMLLSDLKIEQERGRISRRKPFAEQGGW
jgi:hypothetical protein